MTGDPPARRCGQILVAIDRAASDLLPAYFALVMATGIVSLAAWVQGFAAIAHALFWLNLMFFFVLWGLTALRAIRHRVVDFLLKPVRPMDLRQVVDFVIWPGVDPLSQAMVALRNGRFDQAASLLEGDGEGRPRTRCWAKLIEAIRAGQDASDLEPVVRTIMPVIAFNSTVPS